MSLDETPNLLKDLLNQIKSDNEDLKLKLDVILSALILPRLGENKRDIKKKISDRIKTELARNIWNSIDGRRDLAEIGKKVKRTPQVVLRYVKSWEQESPPLVYVCMMKEGAKIYKRVVELNLRKPKKRGKN